MMEFYGEPASQTSRNFATNRSVQRLFAAGTRADTIPPRTSQEAP
jgi:hypothetical protein